MPRKNPFPPEADTKPDLRASKPVARRQPQSAPAPRSGPAPKNKKERSEAPTMPPPGTDRAKSSKGTKGQDRRRSSPVRDSDVRPTERMASATVDEVTADLSNDPRRERDDDG
jgi:hypothetical protein